MTIDSRASLLMYTRSQSEDDTKHLFVVLNDPCNDVLHGRSDVVLLVNFSSIKPGITYDTSCILKAGCHEFITRDSYIVYKEARIEPALFLQNAIDSGDFIAKSPVSMDVYNQIISGLFLSGYTARKYTRFFKQAMNQQACPELYPETIETINTV